MTRTWRPQLEFLPVHRTLVISNYRDSRRVDPSEEACPEISPTTASSSWPVVHPHATMVLYLGGSSTLWCRAAYSLQAGDVYLVPGGMPHYTIDPGRADTIALAICTSRLESPVGRELARAFDVVSEGGSSKRRLDDVATERLRWLLSALHDELALETSGRELAIEGYLAVIASHLHRATPASKLLDAIEPAGTSATGLSARALSFISQHATQGISLADVARHVRRSPTHTAAVVKTDTGHTVVEWITRARLATARELLLHTDETVENVGARVGFASASHFHRTFRRHLGSTPARWRATHHSRASKSSDR